MKTAALVLLLGCAARAEDRLLTPVGTSLEAISVRAGLESIRADSVRGIAETYARYVVEQRAAHIRFGVLFRQAHLSILRRYYATALVQKQVARYAGVKPPSLKCRVDSVKGNEAVLVRELPGTKSVMRLTMGQQDGRWHIVNIVHKKGDRWVGAGFGVPARGKKIDVPRPPRMRRSSPKTTIESLRDDMARLRFLQRRGEQRLQQAVVAVLNVLLGADVVGREQARLAKAPGALPIRFHVSEPSPPTDRIVRMGVVATEPVPGVKGQRSAVGHAGFDLQKNSEGSWRITAELTRTQPDAPLKKLDGFFALFFLR